MARKAEISSKQTFRISAPEAQKVLLVGDFTQWQKEAIPMKKGKDGAWTAKVELSAGAHTYRYIVDGQWFDDPDCELRVPNPYGGQDMVRRVA